MAPVSGIKEYIKIGLCRRPMIFDINYCLFEINTNIFGEENNKNLNFPGSIAKV
jgi:hypothetical protein